MKAKRSVIELTPELRAAITQVFDDGQMLWDHSEGIPNSTNFPEIAAQYRLVLPLTNHKPDVDEDD